MLRDSRAAPAHARQPRSNTPSPRRALLPDGALWNRGSRLAPPPPPPPRPPCEQAPCLCMQPWWTRMQAYSDCLMPALQQPADHRSMRALVRSPDRRCAHRRSPGWRQPPPVGDNTAATLAEPHIPSSAANALNVPVRPAAQGPSRRFARPCHAAALAAKTPPVH